MKIAHLCLANYYADNYSYQENILPVEHLKMGLRVEIIASTETFGKDNQLEYTKAGEYLTHDNIKITRLDYIEWLPSFLKKKLRLYKNLSSTLEESDPDILFIHDVQFLSAFELVKYVKQKRKSKKLTVIADCHADLTNSARNILSYWLLHKFIYKLSALALNKVTDKFWGVLPERVEFLHDMYGIPLHKIGLLNMGVEESWISKSTDKAYIDSLKKILNLPHGSIILTTGGRIDHHKSVMIEFFEYYKSHQIDNVYIVFFGSVTDNYKKQFDISVKKLEKFINLGFIDSSKVNEVLLLSDFGIFLGHHSVMWEQSVGLGLPLILGDKKMIDYLNHSNNIIYAQSPLAAVSILRALIKSGSVQKYKNSAMSAKRMAFSYTEIGKKSILEI